MSQKASRVSEVRDDEVVVPLQAVLLADSFAQKFRPITMECPKVLLPLANVPMIDYTLEWLASVGVVEVFIFCCAHAKKVISYLDQSHWKSQPNFSVTTIESNACLSAGDALRLIYQNNVVRGDFILISGDTVSNMCLKQALQEHKERRKKDKLAIMTVLFKRTKPSPVTLQNRFRNDELLVVVDRNNKQLLHYEEKRDYKKETSVILDRSIMSERSAVHLHNDWQDCFIDICSQQVLEQFTDNFDYQHLRRDFLKGILSDEVEGNKIFCYEIGSEYAARVDNFRGYDTISKDILQRWTYPMVPDIQFSKSGPPIILDGQNIYKAAGIHHSRSATVNGMSYIGNDTSIDNHCTITDSVVGEGCNIGCNVIIENCYIWNNVTIKDNTCLRYAIVCDGVIIKAGAVIEPGVILSFNVIIGENFTVPRYSKISIVPQPTEEDSDEEELEYNEAASTSTENHDKPNSAFSNDDDSENGEVVKEEPEEKQWNALEVGVGGAGYRWSISEENYEEEWRHSVAPIPAEKLKELVLRKHQEYEDNEIDIIDSQSTSQANMVEEDSDKPGDAVFEKEVDETFQRALKVVGVEQDHVILEINALRLGFDMTFSDCAGALFHSILKLALEAAHTSPRELLINTNNVLSEWKTLLKHYLKSEDDEVEVLLKFEEICLESGKEFAPIFSRVLSLLYDMEIVTEDAVLSWASEKAEADDADKVFVKQSEAFIKWLNEAEEDEDDEEKSNFGTRAGDKWLPFSINYVEKKFQKASYL